MFKKFLSRKLVAMILGVTIAPWLQAHGASADTINWILSTIAVYIGGQAVVDSVVAFKATPGDPAAAGAPSK